METHMHCNRKIVVHTDKACCSHKCIFSTCKCACSVPTNTHWVHTNAGSHAHPGKRSPSKHAQIMSLILLCSQAAIPALSIEGECLQ
eukprot:1137442-Pelagomonas_calceolata.AAC.5